MSVNPLVSVVIPVYNREDMIKRAIDSALKQSYENLEVIVIDDASKDKTVEQIQELNDSRIKLLKLDQNVGQCKARNKGILSAKGEYIAFLDSDDIWNNKKIEQQVQYFLNSKNDTLGAIYCYCYTKNETKNTLTKNDEGFLRGNIHKDLLGGYCPPSPTLFMVKKNALIEVGMFDEYLPTFVDLDLWLRLSQNYTFEYIPEYLATKFEHEGDQIAKDISKRQLGLKKFMQKWKKDIIRESGWNSYYFFRKERLRGLVEANLNSKHKHPRIVALRCILILLKIPMLKPRLYIKSLVTLLFGVDGQKRISNTVRPILNNQ